MRFDAIYITLALMIISAAIVLGAAWFVLSAFLGMGHYIQSLP